MNKIKNRIAINKPHAVCDMSEKFEIQKKKLKKQAVCKVSNFFLVSWLL